MRKTVSEVMTQISSTVNQEATAPTTGDAEFNLWLQYLNRSQDEWSEAYDWEGSRVHYNPDIDEAQTSLVTLPHNFTKLAGPVLLYGQGTADPIEYNYVLDENTSMYSSLDKYVTVRGDIAIGKSLYFNPGTLASGASLYVQYFSTPTSLTTTTQYLTMEDSQFAVDRTIAYILEARSDPRFQIMESKARDRLVTMVDNANDEHFSSYAATSYIPSTLRRQGFRIGRN